MNGISWSRSGKELGVISWQSLLIAALTIKLLASLALKPTPTLASYSTAAYFLLLLLAAGLSIHNAVERTLGSRSFWVFFALGCGLWSLNQWIFVYYELGLHSAVPDGSIADPTLFLHTILFMAAMAIRPHLNQPTPKFYRSTLNLLLLLFFWVFLYAFLLLPHQYVTWDSTIYNQRFEVLYGVANLVLVSALGVLAFRAQAPWRSIYAHLCGASILFTLVSTIANIANDLGRHYNIRLYAIGKITAVCWFAWVPLRARRLHWPAGTTVRSNPNHRYMSLLAMLAVVALPVIGIWELFRPGESPATRTFRLSVALLFVIFLAVCALVRELLANRELVADSAQARSAAIESEGRFRIMADKAPVMIWMSGTDKLCTFFNQGWLDFTGRSMDEELGNGWVCGVHPDDLANCINRYSSAFDGRVPFEMEYRLRRFDGKYRWIVDQGVPRFEPQGTFCGYIGSCIDITDRKLTEESLQELGGRLITAQEEERTRIARELHDDLSQRLALAVIDLDLLTQDVPGLSSHARKRLDNITRTISGLTSDIHGISHRLHPSRLDTLGLVAALRGLCAEFSEQQALQVRFVHHGVPDKVPQDVILCCFRIAQEALRNVDRHSGASEAIVELSGHSDYLDLFVSDPGAGFEVESVKAHAGLGLISIRERVRLVRGQLSIESQPSKGTRIVVRIPLPRPGAKVDSDQAVHEAKA
jgi:PAS domain S-box-containing protein